jgi:RimJ/RimL family protein N-acetyltransferase
MDVVIRPAIEDDFDACFRLYDAVAAEGKWIGGESPSDRQARMLSFEHFVTARDADTLVAEVADRIVAMLSVEIRNGLAEIGMMVDADWRGRGIGSALMESCLTWAERHQVHKLALTLWPHNDPARALYQKFGFVEEGVLRRHSRRRNGELWDVVNMGLVLDWDAPGSPYEVSD